MKNDLIHVGGKTYKECEVILLPTKKSPILLNRETGELVYYTGDYQGPSNFYTPQHLYILSSEEIKEGDYCIEDLSGPGVYGPYSKGDIVENGKKIIATTDSSLNLPRPSNEFLKAYWEQQGRISKVLVEYEDKSDYDGDEFYGMFTGSDWQMKISPDNTITIKRTVQKIYTQDEMDDLLDRNTAQITSQVLSKFASYYSKEEVIAIINTLRLDESGVMASMSETAHNQRFNQDLDKLINSL